MPPEAVLLFAFLNPSKAYIPNLDYGDKTNPPSSHRYATADLYSKLITSTIVNLDDETRDRKQLAKTIKNIGINSRKTKFMKFTRRKATNEE